MSGAIFVVLAVGWAGYLIPRALKHHDELAQTRSIDRFSQTMRVLARREVVAPRRTEDNPRVVVPVDRPSRARLQTRRRAAAKAARRRRRILIALLLISVAVGTLAALGYLQRWSIAGPATLVVLYLVLCRTLVKREARAWSGRQVRAHIRRRKAEIAIEDAGDLYEPSTVRLRNPQGFEEVSADEDTSAIDVSALPAVALADGSLWDPLPVTLPTYVGKPVVARTVRTIDLADPRVSSSGRSAEDSQLVAQAEGAETDSQGSSQRAVNG